MKAFRFALKSFVLIICFLTLISTSEVKASEYLGDICWQAQPDGDIWEVAVTNMGNGHYLLNGKLTGLNGTICGTAHGSAEIFGNNVYMTINGATWGDYGDMEAWTSRCIIDKRTLNGTIEETLGIYHSLTTGEAKPYYDGVPYTLTRIQCPKAE